MKSFHILILFATSLSGETIDKRCFDARSCATITVRRGEINVVITGAHNFDENFGAIIDKDRHLVPKNQAPFRELRGDHGWIAVAAVGFPGGFDLFGPSVQTYLYNSRQRRVATLASDYAIDSWRLGRFLGGKTSFFQISSSGPQGYSVHTVVYLLHEDGNASEALKVNGTVKRIQEKTSTDLAGLWIDLPTYDGVHANTKGWRASFWQFDEKSGTFTEQ